LLRCGRRDLNPGKGLSPHENGKPPS